MSTAAMVSPSITGLPGASAGPVDHHWALRARWMLFSLVFIGLPVVLIAHACNQYWSADEGAEQVRVGQRFEKVMAVFDAATDPEQYFDNLLSEFERKRFRPNDRALRQHWPGWRRGFERRFPGMFKFTVFDGTGRMVPQLTDGQPPRELLEGFLHDFTLFTLNDSPILRMHWEQYKNEIGPLLKMRVHFHSGLKFSSYQSPRNYFFISQPYRGWSTFMCHVNKTLDWDSIALRDRAAAYNALRGRIRAAVVGAGPVTSGGLGLTAEESADLPEVANLFASSPNNQLLHRGRWWSQRIVSASARVFLVMESKGDVAANRRRLGLVLALSLVFGALTVFSWHLMLGGWTPYVAIRAKLMVLFLYVLGLPLAVMGLEAYNYVQERRIGLENRIWLDNEQALLLFDRKLPQMLGEVQKIMRRVILAPLKPRENIFDVAIQRMYTVKRMTDPGTAELLDDKGKLVTPGGLSNKDGRKAVGMLKGVYSSITRSLNNQTAELNDFASTQLSAMASAVGVDVEYLIAEMARTVTRVMEMRLAEKRSVQAVFPFIDASGMARYLGVFHWQRPSLEREYVRRRLTTAARQMNDTEIYAAAARRQGDSWPQGYRHANALKPFLQVLRASPRTLRGRMRLNGEDYLLTGVRGQELVEFCFVAVTSCRSVKQELAALVWQIGLGSFAMVLISLTVGVFLARKVLTPIGHLADGMRALRERRFEARVPVLDRDEFGDLSQAFNAMIEGMADLEVGRIIQESLFPQAPLAVGASSIYGTCMPASQVGGDYFDYFVLPGNRLGILIGDVSGHGVGAAMVMAMAKGIVSHVAESTPDPAQILDMLNRVLFKTLKRSHMMSCMYVIIDPAAHRMVFSNGGHNDPYLVRGTTVTPIELHNFPLGSRRKAVFKNATVDLEHGDRVLFYTDGFIEAFMRSGEQIGYERTQQALPTLIGRDARAGEAYLRAWHRELAMPGPQADDISVLVLAHD